MNKLAILLYILLPLPPVYPLRDYIIIDELFIRFTPLKIIYSYKESSSNIAKL